MADLPEEEKPHVLVMNPKSTAFATRIETARRQYGADFSLCDISIGFME
jgi:hypothetical protein